MRWNYIETFNLLKKEVKRLVINVYYNLEGYQMKV